MSKKEIVKSGATMLGHAVLGTDPTMTLVQRGFEAFFRITGERANQRSEAAFGHLVAELAAIQKFAGEQDRDDWIAEVLTSADEGAFDALIEGFHTMLSALSPLAQTYIARITALYLSERRQRDKFFRGVGELLINADDDNVADLVRLSNGLKAALATYGTPTPDYIHLTTIKLVCVPGFVGYLPSHAKVVLEAPDCPDAAWSIGDFSLATAQLLRSCRLADRDYIDDNRAIFEFILSDTRLVVSLVGLFSDDKIVERDSERARSSK